MSRFAEDAGTPVWVRAVDDGVELDVLVVPRSSRSRIAGVLDGRLKVQVAAPPADGAANAALIEILADVLEVRRSAISIASGHGGRQKRVLIRGIAVRDVVRRTAG